jgi:hypothetical protein
MVSPSLAASIPAWIVGWSPGILMVSARTARGVRIRSIVIKVEIIFFIIIPPDAVEIHKIGIVF